MPPRPKKSKVSVAEQLVEEFAIQALDAGCAREQIENFIRAAVFLQPKQLQIAATCRQCDLATGPKAILAGGGRGSAKSHAILAQIFCDDCQRVAGLKVLCLRKVGKANKEQIQDFRKKLLLRLPHKYREQASTITFENGSFVVLGNFANEKDIDKYLGLEYDLIYIMESNQLTQSKKVNILSCLRTNKGDMWRPRNYQDTNPGGIDHVANKMLFVEPWKREMEGGKKQTETRYIHSTVDDNKFIDSGYREYLEKLVGWQREAWLHGSWEFMAGAFFSNFHPDTHVYPNAVTDLNMRSIVRWFAGLDYGYSHPTAFVLGCETEDGDIFIVGEYYASNTLIEEHAANIRDLLALFNVDLIELEFIAAGKDCFRVDKDGSTIATEYSEHGIMLTPVHIDRINSWSQIAERFGDVAHQIRPKMFIHKNCTELITQICSAQCDPKRPNDILKMNANPEDGSGGDDNLESCFVGETLIITSNGELPISDIRYGDTVLTSRGWRKVLDWGLTSRSADVFELELNDGRKIIGTGNHPIWTDRGWIPIESLRNYDTVSICLNQNLKQSYSTAGSSAAIPTQNICTCETIFSQVESGGSTRALSCIRKFTSFITKFQKFQKDFKSIIKTAIASIMTFQIWKCLHELSISAGTRWPEIQRLSPISIELGTSHWLGTKARSALNLPKEIGQPLSEKFSLKGNMLANIAEKFSNRNLLLLPSFATLTARLLNKGKILGILKSETARSAEQRSRHTNTETKPKLATVSVRRLSRKGQRPVYNLTVEDCPEYFANGILVHNCRNLVTMAYSSLLSSAKPIQMGNHQPIDSLPAAIIDMDADLQKYEEELIEANEQDAKLHS